MPQLPSPPPSEGAHHAAQETRHLMRERSFPASDKIASTAKQLCTLLGLSGDTGTLMLDMNNGGIGGIRFQEKHKL